MWLLSIWRNGKFFELFTRGPLGGIFQFTRPDESQMIMDLFKKREMGEKGEYRIYEALRDIKRVVDVYDTTHSQVAVILPPVWLLQQKMWEPLLAILCVYLITFSVNIFLFILAVILIGLYFRRGQVTLRVHGCSRTGKYGLFWQRSDLEAQEMCRILMRRSISQWTCKALQKRSPQAKKKLNLVTSLKLTAKQKEVRLTTY